jgi:hypothetical protein
MPPSRVSTVALLVAAVSTAAIGCSMRDEQAVSGGESRWWSTARSGSGGAGLLPAAAAPAAAAAIEYVEGFDAGSKRAAEAGLPLVVVFRAAWCRWSGELVQAAEANPRIVECSRRFICVAVDADRHPETCRQFDVQAFPTVIVLDADRVERYRGNGSSAVAGLAAAMGEVLAAAPRTRRVARDRSIPVR